MSRSGSIRSTNLVIAHQDEEPWEQEPSNERIESSPHSFLQGLRVDMTHTLGASPRHVIREGGEKDSPVPLRSISDVENLLIKASGRKSFQHSKVRDQRRQYLSLFLSLSLRPYSPNYLLPTGLRYS